MGWLPVELPENDPVFWGVLKVKSARPRGSPIGLTKSDFTTFRSNFDGIQNRHPKMPVLLLD
jgi:hypothetical protein